MDAKKLKLHESAELLATLIMAGRELPKGTRGYYVAILTPLLAEYGDLIDDLCLALGIYSNPPLSLLVINWAHAQLMNDEETCRTMVGLMIAGGINKQVEAAADGAHQAMALLAKTNPNQKELKNGTRQIIH